MTDDRALRLADSSEDPQLVQLLGVVINQFVPLRIMNTRFNLSDQNFVVFLTVQVLIELLLGAGVELDPVINSVIDLSFASSKKNKDEARENAELLKAYEILKAQVAQITHLFFENGKLQKRTLNSLIERGKLAAGSAKAQFKAMQVNLNREVVEGSSVAHCLAMSPQDLRAAYQEVAPTSPVRVAYPVISHRIWNDYVDRSELLPSLSRSLLQNWVKDYEQGDLLFNRLDNADRQSKFVRSFLAGLIVKAFKREPTMESQTDELGEESPDSTASSDEGEDITDFDPMFFKDTELIRFLLLVNEERAEVDRVAAEYIQMLSSYLQINEQATALHTYLTDLFSQLIVAAKTYWRTTSDPDLSKVAIVARRSDLFKKLLPLDPLSQGSDFGMTPESIGTYNDHLWVGAFPVQKGEVTYLLPSISKLMWAKSLLNSRKSFFHPFKAERSEVMAIDSALRAWATHQKVRDGHMKLIEKEEAILAGLEIEAAKSEDQIQLPKNYKPLEGNALSRVSSMYSHYLQAALDNQALDSSVFSNEHDKAFVFANKLYHSFHFGNLHMKETVARRKITLLEKYLNTEMVLGPLFSKKDRVQELIDLNKAAGSIERIGELAPMYWSRLRALSKNYVADQIERYKQSGYNPHSQKQLHFWEALLRFQNEDELGEKDEQLIKEHIIDMLNLRIEKIKSLFATNQEMNTLREQQQSFQALPAQASLVRGFARAISLTSREQEALRLNPSLLYDLNRLYALYSRLTANRLDEVHLEPFRDHDELKAQLEEIMVKHATTALGEFLLELIRQLNSPLMHINLVELLNTQTFSQWMRILARKREYCRAYVYLPRYKELLQNQTLYETQRKQNTIQKRLAASRERLETLRSEYFFRDVNLAEAIIDLELAVVDTEA